MDQFTRRNRLLRYASIAMVVAVGLQAGFAAVLEPTHLTDTPHWLVKWVAAYAVFIIAYAMMPNSGFTRMTTHQALLATLQALFGIILIWLYPSFIVSCLLVVVAWQFALRLDFRHAIAVTGAQVVALALIKCSGPHPDADAVLVFVTCGGFQLFAVGAAQLLRSEMAARDELVRANTELKATRTLLDESARLAERLRIARDLHDVMGHTLTTLTIQLDVASRMINGPAAEHLACARTASGELLEQVRAVVSRLRSVQRTSLRAALEKLAENAREVLEVRLQIPPNLAISDPALAETIIRCVQEVITNAVRHAQARQLAIDVRNSGSGISITARDDGRGGEFSAGSGLAGMRERFEMMGGSLSFRSTEGEGFTIEGMLPMAGSML